MAQPQSIEAPPASEQNIPSFFHGPSDPPLLELTLGDLLDIQATTYGLEECITIPWTNTRWTYADLNQQADLLARVLLDMGLQAGDRVGIMAGNCAEYVAVFFAVARIGCILVILNNTYTAVEAEYGLSFSECKVLFTTPAIGKHSNGPLLARLAGHPSPCPKLQEIILLREPLPNCDYRTYADLVRLGSTLSPKPARQAADKVSPHAVCNLQFTSGTTGHPKAAMLTHHGILNCARFLGMRMALSGPSPDRPGGDVLICPPPLFHCFGLVLGMLAAVTAGARVVYPSEVFSPQACLESAVQEGGTACHGVPAMFESMLSLLPAYERSLGLGPGELKAQGRLRLRTGIVAGAPVPRWLMRRMVAELGMSEFTSSYGLTEASPTVCNAFVDDPVDLRLATVGTLLPHVAAKLVDRDGNTVPVGARGEIWVSGYQVQPGYWNNSEKTNEVCVWDKRDGRRWLRTGDEGEVVLVEGKAYWRITGRFKDIIIRGGENVYPLEIEERLVEHPAISRAVVVGIPDPRLGEVVAAFLDGDGRDGSLSEAAVRDWVREKLGRHKAPEFVWWFGKDGAPADVPVTGSGKMRKFEMAKWATEWLKERRRVKL